MAKLYGDRWELVRSIGQGGQGEVFEARDISQPLDTPTVALKRVKNANRHARFRNEIEAIEKLNHPNVIKLIDHSALDVEVETPEKQYLVMPLARGGDLSKRVSIYRENLDGTLLVANQIGAALQAAHVAEVIHRDVKPQNILFAAESNDIWLTDFGICFLRNDDRPTGTQEVVGPWAFMAPELEYGGQLDVRQSADIYSLGKVIYYMISGGVVIPRERISDQEYSRVFAPGGRFHLLNLLLRKMICDVASRFESITDVMEGLARITDWDRQSDLVAVEPHTRAKLEELQRTVIQAREVSQANLDSLQAQREVEAQVRSHLTQWLLLEFEKAALIISGGVISTSVRTLSDQEIGGIQAGKFRPISGVELELKGLSTTSARRHTLQVLLCHEFRVIRGSPGVETVKPIEDREIGILPGYGFGPESGGTLSHYLLATSGTLVALPQHAPVAQLRPAGGPPPRDQTNVLFQKFHYSEWPAVESALRDFIGLCCDKFTDAVQRNKDSAFPR
jgi:serine/threonine protein kinase